MTDAVNALVQRVRSGGGSDQDREAVLRAVEANGIPVALLNDIRDAALWSWCQAVHPDVQESATLARLVRKALIRYVDGQWNRGHRDRNSPPAEIIGDAKEHLWRAAKHGAVKSDGAVISIGQLRRILA